MNSLLPDLMTLGAVTLGLLGVFYITWAAISKWVLEAEGLAFQDEHLARRELLSHESLRDGAARGLAPIRERLGSPQSPGSLDEDVSGVRWEVEGHHERLRTAVVRADTATELTGQLRGDTAALTTGLQVLERTWTGQLMQLWESWWAGLLGGYEEALRQRRQQVAGEFQQYATQAELLRERAGLAAPPMIPETPGRAVPADAQGAIQRHLATTGRLQRDIQSLTDQTMAVLDEARQTWLPQFDTILDADGSAAELLRQSLAEAHLEPLEPELGTVSDGLVHEEIAQGEPTPACPAGHVLRTAQRGYRWQSLILRKAKVVVATGNG